MTAAHMPAHFAGPSLHADLLLPSGGLICCSVSHCRTWDIKTAPGWARTATAFLRPSRRSPPKIELACAAQQSGNSWQVLPAALRPASCDHLPGLHLACVLQAGRLTRNCRSIYCCCQFLRTVGLKPLHSRKHSWVQSNVPHTQRRGSQQRRRLRCSSKQRCSSCWRRRCGAAAPANPRQPKSQRTSAASARSVLVPALSCMYIVYLLMSRTDTLLPRYRYIGLHLLPNASSVALFKGV